MVNIISHQCFEADVESFNPLGPVVFPYFLAQDDCFPFLWQNRL